MKNCRRESWGNDSECYKSAFVHHKMKKKILCVLFNQYDQCGKIACILNDTNSIIIKLQFFCAMQKFVKSRWK